MGQFSLCRTLFRLDRLSANRGPPQFDHLQDYAIDLMEYLKEHQALPDVGEESILSELASVLAFAHSELKKWMKKELPRGKKRGIDADECRRQLMDVLKACNVSIRKQKLYAEIAAGRSFRLLSTARFKGAIKEMFCSFLAEELYTNEIEGSLVRISNLLAKRRTPGHAIESGIVVAGFGEKDVFPGLCSLKIRAPLAGQMRRTELEVQSAGNEAGTVMVPFAQIGTAQAFMNGIDPALDRFQAAITAKAMNEIADAVVDSFYDAEETGKRSKTRKILAKAIESSLKDIQRQKTQYQTEEISDPIMNAVHFLSLDELAGLAESIVTTTSLRKRVSMELETVGGATDVAIISKGDGFVWIKRKNYFDPRLNTHFFDRAHLLESMRAED